MFNRSYEGRAINGPTVTEGDNYGYDELYRLTRFERDVPYQDLGVLGQGQQGELREYGIDGVQNWGEIIIDGQATSPVVNSVNEYTSFGSDMPLYDTRGNMVESGGTPNITYRYDFLNRLREVEDVAAFKKIKYTYDAHGRRVATEQGQPFTFAEIPNRTEFVYDGIEVIEERAIGQGGLARRFVLGRALDEPVRLDVVGFFPHAGEAFYYQQSTLGNVVGLTDGVTGAVVERYGYDAYGRPEVLDNVGGAKPVSRSEFANPYLFGARRHELELSAYYYFRARFYSPELGRFIQSDPIGSWADMGSLGNPYCFVGGNPLNRVDPLGLEGGFFFADGQSNSFKADVIAGIAGMNSSETGRQIYEMARDQMNATGRRIEVSANTGMTSNGTGQPAASRGDHEPSEGDRFIDKELPVVGRIKMENPDYKPGRNKGYKMEIDPAVAGHYGMINLLCHEIAEIVGSEAGMTPEQSHEFANDVTGQVLKELGGGATFTGSGGLF